jgi:hypothetical protein
MSAWGGGRWRGDGGFVACRMPCARHVSRRAAYAEDERKVLDEERYLYAKVFKGVDYISSEVLCQCHFVLNKLYLDLYLVSSLHSGLG